MTPNEFAVAAERAQRLMLANEITTSTADATAQLGVPVQADTFIRVAMDKSVLMNLIPNGNKQSINASEIKLPRVTREARSTVGGLGEVEQMATGDYMAVTFDERTATPKPFELGLKTSRRIQFDNVERARIEATLEALAAESYGEDIEEAALRGDSSGSDPSGYPTGLLSTIDGYETKLIASGNPLYTDGAYVGEDLLQDMIEELPVERRKTIPSLVQRGYKYLAPSDVVEAWVRRLQRRPDGLGAMNITGDGTLVYRSIPIVGIPHMATNLNGAAGHAVSQVTESFGRIILGPVDDLYVYWNPVMFVHRGVRVEDGKILYYYIYAAMDVQISVPENFVIALDVYPTVDPTSVVTW